MIAGQRSLESWLVPKVEIRAPLNDVRSYGCVLLVAFPRAIAASRLSLSRASRCDSPHASWQLSASVLGVSVRSRVFQSVCCHTYGRLRCDVGASARV